MPASMSYVVEDIPITPRQLAEAFWEMDETEQVEFFNSLSDILDHKHFPLMVQMEGTRKSQSLTVGGRLVQKIIGGDY